MGLSATDAESVPRRRADLTVEIVLLATEARAHLEVLALLVDMVQRDGWDATPRAARAELATAFDALLAG